MTLPANYDASLINVDSSQLSTCVNNLNTAVSNINNDLANIMNSLGSLRLSWMGQASNMANQFNTEWEFSMGELFGTQADPSDGILNILSGGVAQAVSNYSNTEASIMNMWNSFMRALMSQTPSTPTDFTDTPSGTPNPNYHTTAVNETGV